MDDFMTDMCMAGWVDIHGLVIYMFMGLWVDMFMGVSLELFIIGWVNTFSVGCVDVYILSLAGAGTSMSFVAPRLLSRQKYACHDKIMFVAIKRFSRQIFVTTS